MRCARPVSQRPEERGVVLVDGRELPYVVRFSSQRRRSYCMKVDKAGVLQFAAPRWVRTAELLDFAKRRKRFIAKRLEELAHREARRAVSAELDGLWCPLPDAWFKQAARTVLAPRLAFWAAQVGVEVHGLRITSGQVVWGSCNSLGNISLSWRLLTLPEPVREYVVLHEVCHRRYMSHGPRFWALVGRFCPEYLVLRRQLGRER